MKTLAELDTDQAFQLRQFIWKDTLSMFRDFQLFGVGMGGFSSVYPQYQTFLSDLHVQYTENDYLQFLAETGILGILGIISAIILLLTTTLKSWKKRNSRWSIVLVVSGISAVCSLLVHSIIDFNLHIPSNALLLTVIAALTDVAAHSHRRSL